MICQMFVILKKNKNIERIRNRVFEEDKEIIEVSGEDIIIVNKDL